MKPTEKQKRFVDEYLKDLNASAAARRAGYSTKTADRIGPELLGKTCVSKLIAERIQKRQQRTEITQDSVLRNLKALVDRSMRFDDAPHMQAALKANELLGKHLGMFTDKIKLEGELTVSGILEELVKRKEDA
ncbi:terminase small subunit [Pyramidobacter piscolens]|uniref:terminase small subunit n=1 Tax=Pyramidobacter piscolens TaxID=638849 RepID=UPI002664FE44|nr:terminase small subunit [Pyramidobacter piscolens]